MERSKGKVTVREIECKSILNQSGLADYALNCYLGCQHSCIYCYARFMMKFSGHTEPWGSFVDVKINAPSVLSRQIKRAKPGRVFISSVCDGWQPQEEKYELTRKCLEVLSRYDFPVTILTKSSLVRRDFDLLGKMKKAELGATLTVIDPDLKKTIEPCSSATGERIKVLEEARQRKIKIYVFLGPFLPYLTDTERNLCRLFQEVRRLGASQFYFDRLNLRWQVWPSLKAFLHRYHPELLKRYREIFFEKESAGKYSSYLKNLAFRLAKKYDLTEKMHLCF